MYDPRLRRLWEFDPEFGHAPWRSSPIRAERVLHIHLSTPDSPQTSLCRALASLAADDGYCRVDWTSFGTLQQRHKAVVAAAAKLRPTLIFMQLQRPDALATATVAEARRAAGVDDATIVSWCGDVGGANGPFPDAEDGWGYELSAFCDLMLYSSMSQVRAHRSRGMLNAAYLQIGYDEDSFYEGPEEEYGCRFDVAFLGARYHDRQWSSLPGQESALRTSVVDKMRIMFRDRFGLFGSGWGGGIPYLPQPEGGEVYRKAHLALSISLCSFLERYTSDRLFRTLACGTPTLLKAFDDWESFGLADGENVLIWDTVGEVLALAEEWLSPLRRSALREIGRRGARLAREHHSWGTRMQELFPFISAVRREDAEVTRPW